jgi:dihydrofolate synthase/folylpolyglutamate synthase
VSSFDASVRYLYALQNRGMKFGLRNTRILLKALGDPHRKFPSIHVAGTNGKGSTSAFLASILQEAGYRTGLYTSPHLLRFTERVRINGVEISPRRVIAYVRRLRPEIERTGATFFEATTAIAFCYFADEEVDVAVVETGLGGRLDATNLLLPMISVITSIGKDHTDVLGKTLEEIAAEKGGIIKRNRPVITQVRQAGAEAVLRRIARVRRSPYFRAGNVSPLKRRLPEGSVRVRFTRGVLAGRTAELGLHGTYQARNAQTAVAAISILERRGRLKRVSPMHVVRGLARVHENTGIRGRFEFFMSGGARTLVDVAHNPDGIRALADAVRSRIGRPAVIVFGVMADKDAGQMLRRLRRIGRRIVVVAPVGHRALSAEVLGKQAREAGFTVHVSGSVARGLSWAQSMARGRTVLVTGSHYVIGEAMEVLK